MSEIHLESIDENLQGIKNEIREVKETLDLIAGSLHSMVEQGISVSVDDGLEINVKSMPRLDIDKS